ncbi:DNA repair protein recN [Borrelia hermsii YBT]|uniref:AAA family ATPase n=1 Tax=Borrelia hermsii TaxID=140 RepID=UPI0003E315BD|nr:AAA family ATPase [Borrelia hermsii]AHH12330.1 DNA repair protein recN [Borrelia hermsii YBT]
MLVELFIRNFVLIKEVPIKLSAGLVALTGESGSGKSLLLSSIYYLFGGKIKNDIIVDGEQECVLLAKFRVNDDIRDYLSFKGILALGFIVIKRVIIFKSSDILVSNYYINNEPISSAVLKSIFNMLIEVHFQNQQYLILKNPSNNLKILDNYANLNTQLEEYKLAYEAYIKCLKIFDDFVSKEKLHKDSREECDKIIDEIDSLSPKIGENKLIIFDEIDSGIGGESGVDLGKYSKELSENMQIIVVTHLANIASLLDYHILVKKECIKDETFVQASLLLGNDRALEVARMLSGSINDISFRHAEELLKR